MAFSDPLTTAARQVRELTWQYHVARIAADKTPAACANVVSFAHAKAERLAAQLALAGEAYDALADEAGISRCARLVWQQDPDSRA